MITLPYDLWKLLVEWRDARQAIFDFEGMPPRAMIDRVAAAELALMTYTRPLPNAPV